MANRLAEQTSPYLLQHQDNPVDWRPWDSEALAEARETAKPILLSIGYAACHWCHVMAHESFEDPDIAALINQLFVPIKVDREERPDLDAIYQQALAMMGQSGGWPLTMFLTPEGDPFWGGTYFPPSARYGRPGFPGVLRTVADAWAHQPDKVRENVAALRREFADGARTAGDVGLTLSLLDDGARRLVRLVDTRHGGLRGAPKFPQPGIFDFLWRAYLRTGDVNLRDAVTHTLERIGLGGIYDHLGGGFMRYSTDEEWLVPHFEKMLYDNAGLIDLLTLAWQHTGNPLFRLRVNETAEWVLREMVAEGGAFAASLDADSEGEEGRFYTWSADAVARLLPPETAPVFARAYDVRPQGNWEGRTILHRTAWPDPDEAALADARAILWRERESRPRPGRDDKVLADWNGMMIAALANAAFAFAMPRWLDAARLAFDMVRHTMALPGDRLAHALRFGRASGTGLVDDLAHMARAALVLAEATGDPAYVDYARAWVDAANLHHWDDHAGGYFQAPASADDVIVRLKPFNDSPYPSANGIMAQVCARLWAITGDDAYRLRAERTIAAFSARIPEHYPTMTAILAAFEQLADPVSVVVAGPTGRADTLALVDAVAATALPTRIVVRIEDGHRLPASHPAHGKGPVDGKSAAYVCRGSACSAPVTEPDRLRDTLASG
ncbi:MAG: thioredoxin domain-containing protein [Magnetospirillum sp.]|nr:thioredoxin domain-containing protein [Magnetospirillum sp.]